MREASIIKLSKVWSKILVLKAQTSCFENSQMCRSVRSSQSINFVLQTFLSVSLGDLARRCHLHDWGNAERYLMEMNAENKICVTLDKEHGLVYFDEPKVSLSFFFGFILVQVKMMGLMAERAAKFLWLYCASCRVWNLLVCVLFCSLSDCRRWRDFEQCYKSWHEPNFFTKDVWYTFTHKLYVYCSVY